MLEQSQTFTSQNFESVIKARCFDNTLPVASLGLRLDNKVVRITVGLRLGLPLCRPHRCVHCEVEVYDPGTHSLSCRFSKGCHPHHGAVNDIVKRSLEAAKIPSHLEPTDIYRSDGKCPDGHPLSPGRVVECWSGMPHALIPWPLPIQYLQQGKLAGAVAAEME